MSGIAFGLSPIAKLAWGSTDIKKVSLGSTDLWSASVPPQPNAFSTFVTTSSGTSRTINYPTSAISGQPTPASGDLLILTINAQQTTTLSGTITTPSGWTLLESHNNTTSGGDLQATFWRFRSTETSVSVSTSLSDYVVASIISYPGAAVNATTPISLHASSYTATQATACGTPALPSATTVASSILCISFAWFTSAVTFTWTTPPVLIEQSSTQYSSIGAYLSQTAAVFTQSAAGSVAATTCTANQSCYARYGVTLAIAPP